MPELTTHQTTSGAQQPVKWYWTRHRRCVGLARAQLRKSLARWGMAELEFAAVVVLSELVTNAVVHARVPPGREVLTRFVPLEDGVRIEVHDASDEWPVPRVPDEAGGYGLALVAELSSDWGVEKRRGIGKCVWAACALTTTDCIPGGAGKDSAEIFGSSDDPPASRSTSPASSSAPRRSSPRAWS